VAGAFFMFKKVLLFLKFLNIARCCFAHVNGVALCIYNKGYKFNISSIGYISRGSNIKGFCKSIAHRSLCSCYAFA